MGSNDFITDFMTWSYSNATTFETCPYAWKLTYIDREERYGNFFSDFGLVVHEVIEEWWAGLLDEVTIITRYNDLFAEKVTHQPPPFLQQYNILDRYKDATIKFLKDFSKQIERDDYELLGNESTVDSEVDGIKLTIRPDTIVRHKKSDITYLVDYKTSSPFTKGGKPQEKKIDPYWKQMSLYAYFIEKEENIKIDKLRLYFPRVNMKSTLTIDYNKEMGEETLAWWYGLIEKAKEEDVFEPKPEKFFCENLCSVAHTCEHWKEL